MSSYNALKGCDIIAKEDAIKWARESESKIEKGLLEDLSQANAITLKELLQQYKSEESVKKKGGYSEGTKINSLDLMRNSLSKNYANE